MKRKVFWFVFLILLFISSYYRELIFRSVNALIEGKVFFYAKTTSLPFLEGWSKAELINLKYFLTLSFSILFIGLTVLGLFLSYRSKMAYLLSVIIYVLIVAIMIVIGAIGIPVFGFNDTYPFLRMLIGWIHSPLLYLFLSIGISAYQSINQES